MKSLKEKMLYLNELCGDSLTIIKYNLWEVGSYLEESFLRWEKGSQQHEDLETAIDNAIAFCERKLKEGKKDVINT